MQVEPFTLRGTKQLVLPAVVKAAFNGFERTPGR